jgi:hypothetical protein
MSYKRLEILRAELADLEEVAHALNLSSWKSNSEKLGPRIDKIRSEIAKLEGKHINRKERTA